MSESNDNFDPFSSTESLEDLDESKKDRFWYRKIPISEFVDFKKMKEDPWADLMAELDAKIEAQKAKTVTNDSSVEIIKERKSCLNRDVYGYHTTTDSTEIKDQQISTVKGPNRNPCHLSTDSFFINNDCYRHDLTKDSTEISNHQMSTDEINASFNNIVDHTDLSQLTIDSVFINNDFYRRDLIMRDLTKISYQRFSTNEISDFLSNISEASDLSHLSTDSVFIHANDSSMQIDTISDGKVKTNVMKYVVFMEKIVNATMNMLYNLKNYLWKKTG